MRVTNFLNLRNHPIYKKQFYKLSIEEHRICKLFLIENIETNISDYDKNLNRLFLDKEKPKHWKEILDLLSASKI